MGRRANVSESTSHCREQTPPHPWPMHPPLDSNSLTECWCPLEPVGDSGPDTPWGHGRGLGMSG